jgi:hypothetical protein
LGSSVRRDVKKPIHFLKAKRRKENVLLNLRKRYAQACITTRHQLQRESVGTKTELIKFRIMEGHDPLVKDAEIRKSMWEGQVPIVFQLNPDEVTSLQPPEPYYISFPPLHHSYRLLSFFL